MIVFSTFQVDQDLKCGTDLKCEFETYRKDVVDRFGATLGVPSELTVTIKHCCVAIMSFISCVSVAFFK